MASLLRSVEHLVTCLPQPLVVSQLHKRTDAEVDQTRCPKGMLPDEYRLSLHRPSNWGAKAHSNAAVALAGIRQQRFVAAFMHFGEEAPADSRH